MKIVSGAHSQRGSSKKTNLDYRLTDEALGLYLVIDAVYEKDDATPIEKAAKTIQEFLKGYVGETRPKKCVELLESAFAQLNARLVKENKELGRSQSLVLSVDALWVRDTHAIVSHVGNTRTYVFRGGKLYALTEDHLYGTELVKQGIVKPDEVHKSPMANVLTRSIGQNDVLKVDAQPIEIGTEDLFLLCTNGVTRAMSHEHIGKYLFENQKAKDLAECVQTLVALAHRNDPRDNATAILARTTRSVTENKTYSAQNIPPEEKLKLLGQVFLFRHLNYTEANKVLNACQLMLYGAGDFICKEGEPGDEMYIVATGKAEIIRDGKTVAETKVGETIGEVGLIDKQPRTASVRAKTDMWLLIISRESFLELVNKDLIMGNKMLWAMLVDLNQKFRSNARSSAKKNQPSA